MKKDLSDPKEGIERWLDERIRLALGGLTAPLENRIKHLRKRVEKLQAKLQSLSALLEQTLESTKRSPQDQNKN
jgi:hypothetical protein